MDPLSIAASIAGLLTLTGTIISKGYAFASRVKNVGDIDAMLNQIAGFSGILSGMKAQYAANDELLLPKDWLPEGQEKIWHDSITECTTTLEELDSILSSLSSANTLRLMVKGESMSARFEKLVSKIERFKSFFVLCLQLQSNVDSKNMGRLTSEVLSTLGNLVDSQESFKNQNDAREESKKRKKIVEWLGPTSEAVQEDISRVRNAQSSQWLLEQPDYLSWLKSDGAATFWLCGMQGSGKTVIVSKVIESIQTQHLKEGDVLVYHYCRFSDRATLTSERLLGALIAQLLNQTIGSNPIPESLDKLFTRYRSSLYPTLKELQQSFHDLCKNNSRVFVIVDGLDEIIVRKGLLEFFSNAAFAYGNFRVFVASRSELDLEEKFKSFLTVAITPSDIQLDMEIYVQQSLEKLQIDSDEETDQLGIARELVERAQGMFLWAVCQIDHISRIRTGITADTFTTLPKSLEKTFEGVLMRLENDDQLLALKILRVIMFSQRPLDLSEVVEAVAVTSTTRNLKELRKTKLRRSSDVFQLCGSLVHQSKSTRKISLAHYSVQEFLTRPCLEKDRKNPFFLERMESTQIQFETCIAYLRLEDFALEAFQERSGAAQGVSPINLNLDATIGEAVFLDYASNNWATHLNNLGPEGMQLTGQPLLESFLFGDEGHFEVWALVSQYIHGDYKFPNGTKPIHAAITYGLENLVLELLRNYPLCINLQTSDGRSPLHIALEIEREVIIDLLIQKGASLMLKDERGRTPLHAAIESGSELAVAQLVAAGANVNAVQSDGRSPLFVAIENRWDILAKFLSPMIDPKILLPDRRNLLHVAAHSGSFVWTKTLLELHKKELLDAKDSKGWTPLHYAVDQGHTNIAKELILSKCLISTFNQIGCSPLHTAICRRKLECASLILDAEWPDETLRQESSASSTESSRSASVTRFSRPVSLTEFAGPATCEIASRGRLFRSWLEDGKSSDYPNLDGVASVHGAVEEEEMISGTRRTTRQRSTRQRSTHQRLTRRQLSSISVCTPRLYKPKLTCLRKAVEDSYIDGVELLSKFPAKHILLGVDDKEKIECLTIAIDLANTRISLILQKMISKQSLIRMLHEVDLMWLFHRSKAVLEWMAENITIDQAYSILIPRAMRSNQEQLFPIILRTWPDAPSSFIHKTLCYFPSITFGYSETYQKLVKIFLENGVPASKLFAEQREKLLLHSMIEAQDLDFVKFLINNGANVKCVNEQGETPLLILASLRQSKPDDCFPQTQLDLAQLLVSHGAYAQAFDRKGRGFCHRAAAAGNKKLLEYALCTLSLKASFKDEQSRTPLSLAVESGSWEVVDQILEHFAMVERTKFTGDAERIVDAMEYANLRSSPLLLSIVESEKREHKIMVSLVEADEKAYGKLSRGRQIDLEDLRNSFYYEALCWTIRCNFFDGFTFLLPRIPKPALFSCANFDGDNVFHSAAAVGEANYLKTLIQRLNEQSNMNKIIQTLNTKGKSPLDIAIEVGSHENSAILLRSGAKLTPLQAQMRKEKGEDL